MAPLGWFERAACHHSDVELFYAEEQAAIDAALAICAGCPVREPCLELALGRPEPFGIWGGTTESQRRRLLRSRRRNVARRRDPHAA